MFYISIDIRHGYLQVFLLFIDPHRISWKSFFSSLTLITYLSQLLVSNLTIKAHPLFFFWYWLCGSRHLFPNFTIQALLIISCVWYWISVSLHLFPLSVSMTRQARPRIVTRNRNRRLNQVIEAEVEPIVHNDEQITADPPAGSRKRKKVCAQDEPQSEGQPFIDQFFAIFFWEVKWPADPKNVRTRTTCPGAQSLPNTPTWSPRKACNKEKKKIMCCSGQSIQ